MLGALEEKTFTISKIIKENNSINNFTDVPVLHMDLSILFSKSKNSPEVRTVLYLRTKYICLRKRQGMGHTIVISKTSQETNHSKFWQDLKQIMDHLRILSLPTSAFGPALSHLRKQKC
jgi:hypothetical protein